MLIVDEIDSRPRGDSLDPAQRDALVLTAEQRRWTRRRVITSAGRELALALPTGTVLQPGVVLARGPDWYVQVEAAREPVLAFIPASREAALRAAFEIGNHHFALALDGDSMLVADDPAMVHLLTRLGVVWERRRAVFIPLAAGHRHEA
jgi:urease accessory protein